MVFVLMALQCGRELGLGHSVVVVKLLNCVQLLQPHGLQHAGLPCPSQSLGVYSNSCPVSQ